MRFAALGAVLWLAASGGGWAGTCDPGTLELRLENGHVARFTVDIAADPATRAKGLMFRETMPKAGGMLFLYDHPQHAEFWMKNTLIPLDMIFADQTGLVTVVHSNAIPHDETGIDGGDGVLAVLEINGGLAKRLGIAPGAVLRHPALDQTLATWPCTAQ